MSQLPITWLAEDFSGAFPDPEQALREPDGLLAAGGNLLPETLLQAYSQGIFPWYSDGQPILWWSPDPRCVLLPDEFHVSRSFRRSLNRCDIEMRIDTAFRDVIRACAEPRPGQDGTWITTEILEAYSHLHELGYAHSVECWQEDRLVGGVYGILMNGCFFGESMFSRVRDASKIALHHVCTELRPRLLDAQVHTPHLESLGARMMRREDFIELIRS